MDDSWEEIVEVPFQVTVPEVTLGEWGGQAADPLPLAAGDYRARYCARGMQHGRQLDTIPISASPADFYSLAFWPATPAPDHVLKQTSEIAAYWHATARRLSEGSSGSHQRPFPRASSRER